VTPSSNYIRERNWLKTSFCAIYPVPDIEIYFPFRCQTNKLCANSTLKWMLWNKIKLITWHPRQITLGYCDWSEIGWKTSFCELNPITHMEIYILFRCQPNNSSANTTPTWMLSNKLKLITWQPRQLTLDYCDWSATSQKPTFFKSTPFAGTSHLGVNQGLGLGLGE